MERLFPFLPDFEFNAVSQAPSVWFLKRYREQFRDGFEQIEKRRELAERYQKRDGYVDEKLLPALVARRDALKTQIQYDGERLRSGPLKEIKSLLMVWLEEAVKEGSNRSRSDGYFIQASPHYRVTGLWKKISLGVRTEELNKEGGWLDMLSEHGNRVLANAQRSRILEVLEDRDRILEQSAPIKDQFRLCETILQRVLNNDPIPPYETLQRQAAGLHDKRQVHLHHKDWIVERYWAKRQEKGCNHGKAVEEIQQEYAEKFGSELRERHGQDVSVMPSEKTIRDYRDGER